uniref:Prolyl endopeptidase n=1 Tax=Mucochytrium quahogii TaxID=96639 RepID=A0A7S2SLW6_9STRA|mmetsp:Transcript_28726/g.46470  ORF Transcript_28726/g.46470 Transcript_28726/m.46470 type:complete len:737 (+) Transcript_28726:151-2361(+)
MGVGMADGVAVGAFAVGAGLLLAGLRARSAQFDPRRFLEDRTGGRAMSWVKAKNAQLPFSGEGETYDRILRILDSKEKIPYLRKIGKWYYNFWRDEKNERGLWRRTTLEEYQKDPSETKWQVVIDLDAINESEEGGKNKWVWSGVTVLDIETEAEPTRCLINLSPGGSDSVEVREFDLSRLEFVDPTESPFYIPVAKTYAVYKDRDTLLVGSDFGPGSLTDSGYPRVVKEWKRGTDLTDAPIVFEGKKEDVSASGTRVHERHGLEYEVYQRTLDFYRTERFVKEVKGLQYPAGSPMKGEYKLKESPLRIQLPLDVSLDYYADQVLVQLRSDWKRFPSGSLLSIPAVIVLEADKESLIPETSITPLFVPRERVALKDYSKTKSHLLLVVMENVKSYIQVWKFSPEGPKKWSKCVSSGGVSSEILQTDCWAVDSKRSELYWKTSEGFTQPGTLYIADSSDVQPEIALKNDPIRYDASDVVVEQFQAKSKDGTLVPYFQVYKKLPKPSTRPTLLYGYGGFEISLEPSYPNTAGVGWLEKGNVYVCANIRGGGEFGPSWHQAALKEKRHKAFEDFEAVANDLVRRKVTTHKQLGCMGGSNGGLLVGNMVTRSPNLFGAVVCQCPLLDMKRYSHLLAGASWMAEYGDPDTDDWTYLKHNSPYHNLSNDKQYPPVFFTTSTSDDRVCCSHARKMAHKMGDDMCIPNIYIYENIEGGHAGGSTNSQRARMWTLSYQFLSKFLN